MPVAPGSLDAITSVVVDLYKTAEAALVALIAHWIAADNFNPDLPGPQWAEQKLASIRPLLAAARAVQDAVSDQTNTAVAEAAAAAFKAGAASPSQTILAALGPDHPLTAAAKRALKTSPNQGAIDALANAVVRDIGQRSQNVLRDVEDTYRAVIAAASAREITGVQTRRQASQSAYAQLVQRGITGFTDRSGRRWRLSSYVEMAVRTVTQRAAVQGEEDRLRSLGINLVSITNVAEECERCEPFEGRVLSLTGPTGRVTVAHALTGQPVTVDVVATVAEARMRGLWHPNCRHSMSAFLPGVSSLPAQPTADPTGRTARERQRAIERAIRDAKLQQQGALTPDAQKAAGRKVRALQSEMRDHLKAHPNLVRRSYREQIGAGNLPGEGHNDPSGEIWPPRPPETPSLPDPDMGPEHGPDTSPSLFEPVDFEPVPEPGDHLLARLLDPSDDLTEHALLDQLATGDDQQWETGPDPEEAVAALKRFNELAHAGEHEAPFAKRHAAFVKKLAAVADDGLDSYVRRRLGQLKTDQQRAATLLAWWREQARRATTAPRTPGMRHGRRHHSNHEAVDWAMGEMPMPEATPDERSALVAYTGPSYSFINDRLRKWAEVQDWERERFDKYVRDLDSLFAKASLPEALIVHRGTGASTAKSLGADIHDPASMAALVGQVFVEPGYISTSVGTKAAFTGQIYWMFRLPAGYQAINAMHHSQYGKAEREVLVRRGAKYIIHGVYQRPGSNTWWIEAEMVPDDWDPPADWEPDPYGDAHEGY